MNTTNALATLRARLEALEARADARRARDAERDAEPVRTPAPVELPLRDNGAGWMAAHGRDWKAEALADLDAVKPADRPARFGTAPEYREEVAQETPAEAPAQPVAASDAVEPFSGVGAAPQSEPGAEPPVSLARVPGSSPGRRAFPKLPQAVAREDWRVLMHRIDANAMRAAFAPASPALGPFAWALARAGPGASG